MFTGTSLLLRLPFHHHPSLKSIFCAGTFPPHPTNVPTWYSQMLSRITYILHIYGYNTYNLITNAAHTTKECSKGVSPTYTPPMHMKLARESLWTPWDSLGVGMLLGRCGGWFGCCGYLH